MARAMTKSQLVQDAADRLNGAPAVSIDQATQALRDLFEAGGYDKRIKVSEDLAQQVVAIKSKESVQNTGVSDTESEVPTATTDKPKGRTREAAPPKPSVKPESLRAEDYGYTDSKGRFRFHQGFDMVFKSRLLRASRTGTPAQAEKAQRELARRGWSSPEKEEAARAKVIGRKERAAKK